uniref:Uncharacterized protein LOC100184557 n=1 Tax=Phallusia mammillata TaxID=59560 RepID=A0A6F9DI55_9ASCI|nr:uncharacterized protein LOC100184557 [Phallusia mammillata]
MLSKRVSTIAFSLFLSAVFLYLWTNNGTGIPTNENSNYYARPKYKTMKSASVGCDDIPDNSDVTITVTDVTKADSDVTKTDNKSTDSDVINCDDAKGKRVFVETKLLENLKRDCDYSVDDGDLVKCKDNSCVRFSKYKSQKAKEFTEKFANPFKKTIPTPILPKFTHGGSNVVKNPKESINEGQIESELAVERKRRLTLGDDDITKIPEVIEATKTDRIPNIIHFVYFGHLRVRVIEYQAFVGALRYQKPDLILFHTDSEPSGEYWDAFKFLAGKKLKIVKRSPPKSIWGININLVEHKADVARLQILLEVGGIYLDTDSVILTSLQPLMGNDLVLGEESEMDLANGVILAKRDSWFLKRWFWEYKYFDDGQWGKSSVVVPWGLWKSFPDKIFVVKQKICRPNWKEVKLLFHELIEWKDHYVMHLYSRFMKDLDGKTERPLKELAVLNTTYGEVARHAIWGNYRGRDVTNWIVTCNLTQQLISEYNSTAPRSDER